MTRFDSPLPGPFLELSTANLHLNELSVDQLAALWNVFTKVGDSLHKGRRLENFVWRAWHREAHLLPPDASWSDFADCTPLETPALSRAGSISQSLQRKPTINQVMAGYMAATHPDNAPSDPESGVDWSDESEDDDEEEEERTLEPADARIPQRQPASPQSTRAASNASRRASGSQDRGRKTGRGLVGAPPSNLTSPPPSTIPETRQLAVATPSSRTATTSALPLDHIAAVAAADSKDRRRAASSSSAFGSRARVRHLNLRKTTRRRPISFQAALESLTSGNDSDDLACLARDHQKRGLGAAHERRSFQGPVPLDITKTESIETDETLAASHSSAPAASTFELGRTAPSTSPPPPEATTATPAEPAAPAEAAASTLPLSSSAQEMPPPSIPIQPKPAAAAYKGKAPENKQKQTEAAQGPALSGNADASKSGRKAKFFLSSSVGKSYEDEDEEEVAQKATTQEQNGPATKPEQSDYTPSHQPPQLPPPAAAQPKAPKIKSDGKSAALSAAHRSKSGASLNKGKGRPGVGRHGSSGRLAAAGLAMTKAQASHAPAPSALTKPPAKPAVAGNKGRRPSRPVKFIMGADDDDDEDFTDEEEEEEIPVQKVAPKKALSPPRQQAPAVADKKALVEEEIVDDDDDDAWSSDTSAEAEEERQRREAEIRRRRLEEEERQRNLFKKVPIRSASAADVRHVEQQQAAAQLPDVHSHSPPQPQGSQNYGPPRGLLSSLFHPQQEPHPPPGQLHGRPHASAADLRAKPERPPSRAGESKSERRHRPPSLIGITPSGEHGGSLKTSKSAVALPVLNTAQPKVTGGGSNAVADSDAEDDLEDVARAEPPAGDSGSAGSRQSAKRPGYKRAMSSQQTVVESPDSAHTVRRFGSGGSQGSSRSRERPPIPEPLAAPNLAPHRAATALPAPAAAQTPRTTRRNMLRDELSESLRQNLLWERQSRNRMLGIGANAPRATTTPPVAHNSQGPQATASSSGTARQQQQQASSSSQLQQQPLQQQQTAPPPRHLRRETVLGGNQLRPLTQGVSGSHGQVQASHATTSTSAAAAAGTTYHQQRGGHLPGPPLHRQNTQQQLAHGHGHGHHAHPHPHPHHHHSRSTPHLPAALSSPSLQRSQSGSGAPPGAGSGAPNANNNRRLAFDVDSTDDSELSDARDSCDDDGPLPPGAVIGGGGPAAALAHAHGAGGGGVGAAGHMMHDPGGTHAHRRGSREREREQAKVKKRVLYPGGFPNYHQHGW